MIEYVYVFVRMNMLPVQVAVQACHASMEIILKKWGDSSKLGDMISHPHLILCGVNEEEDLREVIRLLERNKVDFASFREPDMNNSLTAIATKPIAGGSIREKLKKYKLLPPFIHNK